MTPTSAQYKDYLSLHEYECFTYTEMADKLLKNLKKEIQSMHTGCNDAYKWMALEPKTLKIKTAMCQ